MNKTIIITTILFFLRRIPYLKGNGGVEGKKKNWPTEFYYIEIINTIVTVNIGILGCPLFFFFYSKNNKINKI